MSKAEFVPKLAEAGKITKKQADDIFSAFVGMISTSLQNGERVALPGLGVFSVVGRKARTGRNPRTGAGDQDTGPESGEVLRLQCTRARASTGRRKPLQKAAAKKAPAKPAKKK